MGLFGGLAVSMEVLTSDIVILRFSVAVSACFGARTFPRCSKTPVPNSVFVVALAFFCFRLSRSGNPFSPDGVHLLQRVGVPVLSPALGMQEVLARCSDVSALLTPKRGVLGFISGRFLTIGSSLSLAGRFSACSRVP
jgi:hypothetical protein